MNCGVRAGAESELARQLDPLSLIIATDKGVILYFARRYDRAIEQFRGVLAMEPNFPRANMIYNAYLEAGRRTEALAEVERRQHLNPSPSPWTWMDLAYFYGRTGKPEQARHAFNMLEQIDQRQQLDPAAMVVAHIGMGDKDEAITWLQKAYQQHSIVMTTLKVDPIFDPLRGDARFQELLRRVGLAR